MLSFINAEGLFRLSVANLPIMLSDVMLNVIIVNVVAPKRPARNIHCCSLDSFISYDVKKFCEYSPDHLKEFTQDKQTYAYYEKFATVSLGQKSVG
jgi:hypothetical protein